MRGWQMLVVPLLLGVACGSAADPTSKAEPVLSKAKVKVVASDFRFEVEPSSVPGGEVETTLVNNGHQAHQVGYYRLGDGVEYDEFVQKITKDEASLPQLADGGRQGVMLGLASGETYVRPSDDLEPGSYALICSIRDPNTGKNHFQLGMVAPFEVR